MSFSRIALIGAVGAAALAFVGSAAAGPPTARTAATCSVGTGEGYGYTYLTSLSVKGTTCATGKTVVRHKGRLQGWRCTKKVLQRSGIQYVARESCSSGSRRVTYVYTQNT
jgi:hypothetical protein